MVDPGKPTVASNGADIADLMRWLDASPTPFHVVSTAAARLTRAGFTQAHGFAGDLPSSGFLRIDGALIAWRLGSATGSYRIVGAHTDSPNLRVHPSPDMSAHGWNQLGIEIYGGVLLNSWLDRDLGVAGRVIDLAGQESLFNVSDAVARVPQLAIHLDRNVNESGVVLDKQTHMMPIWGTTMASFEDWLCSAATVDSIAFFDAHLYDLTPARLIGHDSSLLASGRLDNQVSCWAAITAITSTNPGENTAIVVLNDHEEVGSESTTGAAGPLLERLTSAIAVRLGLHGGAHLDMLTRSWCLSADNAHAIHPNYPERHEPRHAPRPNLGPALKINGNQRYATSAKGAAFLRRIAADNSIPLQTFVSRNNMPCGSTIGPITATRLGVNAIDVGIPQLSMHSARELCGAHDPAHLSNLASAFLQA